MAELIGLEVEQVWVWWSLRLVFDVGTPSGRGVFVDLTDFRFTDAAGSDWDVRVEDDPLTAGPVLGLLHHRVIGAHVHDSTVVIEFDTGAGVVCPPHLHHEAWAGNLPGDQAWYWPPGGFDEPTGLPQESISLTNVPPDRPGPTSNRRRP